MASPAIGWMKTAERGSTSFEDLFLAEYARVVGIAARVVGHGPGAEDVAQDVFCDFYRKHRPDAEYAAAWLHRAAAHAALNVIRGQKRRARRETDEAIGRTRTDLAAEAALDPQRALEAAERRQEVRAALAHLPEKSAAVLILRHSGLSYAEVASALGMSPGSVGTMLRRAEAALRKELAHGAS